MRKALPLLAVLAVLGLGATACGVDELGGKKKATETAAIAQPIHALVIESDAGDVDLHGGSERVGIRATYHYNGGRPHMERTVAGGVLTLKDGCHKRESCSTDFDLTLPAGVAIHVTTDAGNVRGRALDSRVVELKTDAGDIDLDVVATPRRVQVQTDAGNVAVAVPRGTYAVDTNTDAGDVDVHDDLIKDDRAPRSISASTDAGDIEIQAR